MEPCAVNYPCRYASKALHTCSLPRCVMHHVTLTTEDGEYAYDDLTHTLFPWVTVGPRAQQPIDPLDDWYQAWSAREMAQVNTYERVHGRVRPKRHAVNV